MQESIFAGDPLLLRRPNQQRYRRALLHNLLIGRTMATGLPEPVDLHECDTDALENRLIYDPPPPDAHLEQLYLNRRIFRTPLTEAEFEALAKVTMAARPELTGRRLRDIPGPNNTTKARFLTDSQANEDLKDSEVKLVNRLRIAAIGFRVKVSKLVNKGYFKEDLCILPQLQSSDHPELGSAEAAGFRQLGRTTLLPGADHDRWTNTICSHIEKAVSSGSQIIIVPEFGLPPGKQDADLEKALRKSCEENAQNNHFVFAGSRHEGGTNRGMLFHLKDNKLQGHTHWHYKIASARSLGENVLGPYSDEYPSYVTNIVVDGKPETFNVTVAICYDTFDPSTFLSLVLHNAHRENYFRNRLILVPSFNPSSQFVEFLRDLSFLTLCPVVYVNSLHGDAKMFVAGVAMSDILNESGAHVLNDLNTMIESVKQQYDGEQEQARKALPNTAKSEAAVKRAKPLAKREEVLTALLDTLKLLERGGGLRNLITVEYCQLCADKQHVDDYDCATDILYYNIDLRLLTALAKFRSNYFRVDESYIPEPFRRASLARAAKEMLKKMERRKALIAPHLKRPDRPPKVQTQAE